MKKLFITIVVLGIFVLYGLYQKYALTPTNSAATTTNTNTTTKKNLSTTSTSTASTTTINTGSAGTYTDGEYTGNVADAYYGYVQVKTTIQNGKISDVQFLQYPSDRRTSQMINSQAMPMLKNEAIQAQSSNVDVVSGATDTSLAFIQSLGSSLQAALGI